MPTIKVGVSSPDPILNRAAYAESALARIAHINEAVRLMKVDAAAVGKLPTYTNISQTTVLGLQAEVNTKLAAITVKINALITALS